MKLALMMTMMTLIMVVMTLVVLFMMVCGLGLQVEFCAVFDCGGTDDYIDSDGGS